MRRLVRTTLGVALVFGCVTAEAQDGAEAIAAGIEAYEQANLEEARALMEHAAEGPLERSDVVELLAHRVLVYFALGEFGPLERDLLALTSLEPDYALGTRAPPPLQEAHRRIRGEIDAPLSLSVSLEAEPGGVRVRATSRGDRANVVERIVLSARRPSGEWLQGEGGTLFAPVPSGEDVEIFARAVGPGGAVLAYEGTEEEPRTMQVPELQADTTAAPPPSRTARNVAITVTVVAVVAATVLLAFVLRDTDNRTMPIGPILE